MVLKGKNKEFTPSFLKKISKKHEILGGIKVSSEQLSEWGKLGGRPPKWNSEAERKRAERLKKKQLEQGQSATLRNYRSYEEKLVSFVRMICDKCQTKSIGGINHLGGQCFRCFQGKTVKENEEKRAGSSGERWERFREKERR